MAHGDADIVMRGYRAGPLNILIFKKLAGLWWAGEVVNHIWIYGSKVAEGSSAFQRRSCFVIIIIIMIDIIIIIIIINIITIIIIIIIITITFTEVSHSLTYSLVFKCLVCILEVDGWMLRCLGIDISGVVYCLDISRNFAIVWLLCSSVWFFLQ